jgi:hypothetical protein
MTTNYRNQNRQAQRALTDRKNKKINNKKQTIIKTTQVKINRKIQNQNNKLQFNKVTNKCLRPEEKAQIPQK